MTKEQKVQEALSKAIHDAFEEDVDSEILLNKWAFVAEVLVDGERSRITVWDESIHPMDLEALIRPSLRLAENISDMYSVGQDSSTLGEAGPGGIFYDDDDEDED